MLWVDIEAQKMKPTRRIQTVVLKKNLENIMERKEKERMNT